MIEVKKEAKIMQRGVLNRYSSDGTGSGESNFNFGVLFFFFGK